MLEFLLLLIDQLIRVLFLIFKSKQEIVASRSSLTKAFKINTLNNFTYITYDLTACLNIHHHQTLGGENFFKSIPNFQS